MPKEGGQTMNDIGLSFCCVVKDSLPRIKTLIQNIKDICDEIVIVDTGSGTDAREYEKGVTDKAYFVPWNNDFSYMHNFAIAKSSRNWILSLDSDETISKELKGKIRRLVEDAGKTEGYKFNRVHYFDEKAPMSDHRKHLRLYRRSAIYFGAVHESIKNLQNVETVEDVGCYIEHHNTRALERQKALKYSEWLTGEINKAKAKGDKESLTYYKTKKWAQDNIYLLETDPEVDMALLEKRYVEYDKKIKEMDKLMAARYRQQNNGIKSEQ